MNSYVNNFLQAVLGETAAEALKKAGDRNEALSSVIGARTIVGWVNFASRWGYEGEVPGTPGSWLALGKSETGLVGEVRMGKSIHTFEHADVALAGATLCVALGADLTPDDHLRDDSISKLGQQVDLLIMTRAAALAKTDDSECSDCGHKLVSQYVESKQDDVMRCPRCDGSALDKGGFEAPGKQAAQKPPSGAAGSGPQGQGGGFTAPTATAPKRTRPRKGKFQAKLTQSQATSKCSVCEEAQFVGDRFTGCACLRDLAKSVDVEADGSHYSLTFHEPWTKSDVALLMDIVNGSEVYDG